MACSEETPSDPVFMRFYCPECGEMKTFKLVRESGGWEFYQDEHGHEQAYKV